jgi:hypothetical protein
MLLVPRIDTVPITCIFAYGSDVSTDWVGTLKRGLDSGDLTYGDCGVGATYTYTGAVVSGVVVVGVDTCDTVNCGVFSWLIDFTSKNVPTRTATTATIRKTRIILFTLD